MVPAREDADPVVQVPSAGGTLDAHELRRAFGTFATGVTIITTRDGRGRLFGLTANSFSSVSLEPPLVLWSLSRRAGSYPAFRDATAFGVNVLGGEHRELSARFARPHPDKFAGIDYALGRLGVPLIGDAAAHFECTVEHRYEGGDHVIFVGRVREFDYVVKPTLLFCHGKYHTAHELPDA
jgi:3-hydroxy-9,10-secoandrosta-1,3,5(10)-triene-9,17-dione monooxygenase reductase component